MSTPEEARFVQELQRLYPRALVTPNSKWMQNHYCQTPEEFARHVGDRCVMRFDAYKAFDGSFGIFWDSPETVALAMRAPRAKV